MKKVSTQIREVARSLLQEEKVDLMVGYEWGPLPLVARPCLVRSPDDVGRLIWNACCGNNLASYLLQTGERVGVFAKGCDARALAALMVENQVAREKVFIVGVPCHGVIDRRKIDRALGGRELLEASLDDDEAVLFGHNFEERLPLAVLISETCRTCQYPTAPICDMLIGNTVHPTSSGDRFRGVKSLEDMGSAERWAYFRHEFSRCIRCYACRQACPLCYCQECFIDETQPSWLGKTDDPSDTFLFHVVRALHLAGRCVECGACALACPMGIDLMAMNRKLIKDIKEGYGFEAGLVPGTAPLLSTFRPDDPEEFAK